MRFSHFVYGSITRVAIIIIIIVTFKVAYTVKTIAMTTITNRPRYGKTRVGITRIYSTACSTGDAG